MLLQEIGFPGALSGSKYRLGLGVFGVCVCVCVCVHVCVCVLGLGNNTAS